MKHFTLALILLTTISCVRCFTRIHSSRLFTRVPGAITAKFANSGSFSPFPNPNQEKTASITEDDEEGTAGDNDYRSSFLTPSVRQLLGIKDAALRREKWKIRIQLCKPITWVPLTLVTMCGAAASGNYHWVWNPFTSEQQHVWLGLEDMFKGLAAVILAGPFSVGFAQTINDWFDREIDAINEPHRPKPSRAITKEEVFQQLWFLFVGGMSLAASLDIWARHDFPIISAIALYGYFVSYIYSAPPLKLNLNGWTGALAIGTCYISLPWWCGHATFGRLEAPVDWLLYVFWIEHTSNATSYSSMHSTSFLSGLCF